MNAKIMALEQAIAQVPRRRLAMLPTPLEAAPRLSETLGGPKIYFKRDELTGMPLGGNKTRMMEFIVPRILASGADCVVAGAAIQSNYCRQITAACAKAGIEVHLVLMPMIGSSEFAPQGNFLLDLMMGAHCHILQSTDWTRLVSCMHELAARLRAQGRKPYVARPANSEDIGYDATGYVNCALELHRQFEEMDIRPDYLYVTSTDTTQAGLALGFKALGDPCRVVGISSIPANWFQVPIPEMIAHVASKAAAVLGLDTRLSPDEVVNDLGYVGEAYAVPTAECIEAIKLAAAQESVIFDPVYSAKGLAGLIDHIRTGRLRKDQTVVFLHTGGYPANFGYTHWLDFRSQISVNDLGL